MAKDWRCLIGRHDWRVVETDNRDKYAECTRCGKHDWKRLVKWSGGRDMGNLPPGGYETCSQQHTLIPRTSMVPAATPITTCQTFTVALWADRNAAGVPRPVGAEMAGSRTRLLWW
jgi:hypothetical protein